MSEKTKKTLKITAIAVAIFIINFFLSFLIIGFTSIQKLLPASPLDKEIIQLREETDSLNKVIDNNTKYIENIKKILSGNDSPQNYSISPKSTKKKDITEFYNDSLTEIVFSKPQKPYHQILSKSGITLSEINFYPPVEGVVSSSMDIAKKHYGTDIIPSKSAVVKATLDGVVIFSGWTVETGNVIIISHLNNLISIYKHNSSNLKNVNDYVRAGEPIAIAGNSGELTSGQHLHFELWFENRPINAREYIAF